MARFCRDLAINATGHPLYAFNFAPRLYKIECVSIDYVSGLETGQILCALLISTCGARTNITIT